MSSVIRCRDQEIKKNFILKLNQTLNLNLEGCGISAKEMNKHCECVWRDCSVHPWKFVMDQAADVGPMVACLCLWL